MKFIVHIGMPKSGSTALQHGLSSMRPSLTRQGILYPVSPVIRNTSNFLMAGVMPFDALPRYLRQSISKLKRDYLTVYAAWLQKIRDQATKIGAHTVILSGENLYNITTEAQAVKLRAELMGLGATSIEIVVYVRKPSDWYLSAAQQVLRASHLVRPVGSIHYRAVIECFASHVSPQLTVFEYNRALFPRGDILAHFLQNVAGTEAEEFAAEDSGAEADRQFNGTISAEGMSILREYRLVNHKQDNSSFTRDTARLRRAIAEADADVGGDARPALRPEVQDRIDQGSPDVLWLRDVHGVQFSGIDYDRVLQVPWEEVPKAVEDICIVNKKRRSKLLNRAIFLLATDQVEKMMASAKVPADQASKTHGMGKAAKKLAGKTETGIPLQRKTAKRLNKAQEVAP